jgi:PKD domain
MSLISNAQVGMASTCVERNALAAESGATYKWDFDNEGVFDTQPSSDPTVTHVYPDEVRVTATVAVMKGNQVKGSNSVTFNTLRCP